MRAAAVAISAALAAGCRSEAGRSIAPGEPPAPSREQGPASGGAKAASIAPSSGRDAVGGVEFAAAPPGELTAIVRSATSAASARGRRLVVYVGATWCEPCRRFHHAVETGALDADLPGLTLLDLDADRDRDRIAAAGYGSSYIPLFALASPDGTASARRLQGAIKGEGAVDFIVPRLRELLAGPPVGR